MLKIGYNDDIILWLKCHPQNNSWWLFSKPMYFPCRFHVTICWQIPLKKHWINQFVPSGMCLINDKVVSIRVSVHVSPITEVKSSGAELPAAMKVAPATSSLRCRRWKRETESKKHILKRRPVSLKFQMNWPWPCYRIVHNLLTSHIFSREGTK